MRLLAVGGQLGRPWSKAEVSSMKRHLSREKSIPTVREVSSFPSVVGIGVNPFRKKMEKKDTEMGRCGETEMRRHKDYRMRIAECGMGKANSEIRGTKADTEKRRRGNGR
jgi:hypothetical protein